MGRARQGSFAFFNALAQDYAAIVPVSVAARALVGALDRIARSHAEDGED